MYYTKRGKGCQGLILRNSENGVLTGLAQTRDGVLLLGDSITEALGFARAANARAFGDSTNTGNARELGEHLLDGRSLEGGFKRVIGIFHVCIITYLGVNVKG